METVKLMIDTSADLLDMVRDLRDRTDAYLISAGSRRRRLVNVTLTGGALATFLTAAPAFGGKKFATWLTDAFGLSAPAWQLLCACAALCSLAATIATQSLRSHHLEENVAAAQAVRAKLETLAIRVELRQIAPAEAVAELIKCVEDVAFAWRPARPAIAPFRGSSPVHAEPRPDDRASASP